VKFSARVTYGLRAVILLADRYGTGPVLGKEISRVEGLPVAYLEQIMATLRRADLVNGTRGAGGGYVLTRDPRTVTASDVLTALQGPLQLSDCPGGAACCHDMSSGCVVNELFATAEAALAKVFDAITLAELAERRAELQLGSNMFYI
jgi:Rrf2 family transcriptional regulator, cysteine metabolism repressor